MVGGVLTIGGQSVIVTVGGSAAGATTATSDVRAYDPITDTLTVIATDPWPGNVGGTVLPGGAAVVNNVLYVFGGFNIGVSMTDQIWKFDPALAAGSGGPWYPPPCPPPAGTSPRPPPAASSTWRADPTSWPGSRWTPPSRCASTRPPTRSPPSPPSRGPRARRGRSAPVRQHDLGPGRRSAAPNPSTQVNVYNPATDTWSTGPAMTTARRNFAADIDPVGGRIFAAGGYDTTGTMLVALNDQFTCTIPATAVALVVDAAGNGVYQPNETVVVAPSWMNTGATALALTGALTNHTGPAGPSTPSPTARPTTARWPGGTASCTATGNCYSVANSTATRPPRTGTARPRDDHPGRRPRRGRSTSATASRTSPSSRSTASSRRSCTSGVTGGCTATDVLPVAPPRASRWPSSSSCPRSRRATPRPPAAPPRCSPTSGVQPVLPLDRGAGAPWRRRRLRRRNYCPRAGDPRADGGLRAPHARPDAQPAGLRAPMFADVPASSAFCPGSKSWSARRRHRLRRRQLLPRRGHPRADGRLPHRDVRSRAYGL